VDPLFPLPHRAYDEHELLTLTRERLKFLWELAKRSWPVTVDSFHTEAGFVEYVTSPQVLLFHVADGVVMVDKVQEKLQARVHPLFDRGGRIPRDVRIDSARRFLQWLFDAIDVHRLYGETPEVQPHLRAMKRFAKAIGFTHEGVLRDSIYFADKFHNIHIHGLLDTDLEVYNGRRRVKLQTENDKGPDARAAAAGSCELPRG
jgi:hypothetical protein